MTGMETLSRDRAGTKGSRLKRGFPGIITKKDIFTSGIGLLFAMAKPYAGMVPFGMSFLTGERSLSLRSFLYFAVMCVGSVISCEKIGAVKYFGAGFIYMSFLFVLESGIRITAMTAGLVAGGAVFLSGLLAMYWQGFEPGALPLLLFEAFLVVVGSAVMEKGRRLFSKGKFSVERLTNEEKICLGIMAAILIMGMKEMYIGDSFSLMNLMAVTFVLVIGSACGVGYSTAAGIILGGVCGIGTDFFMPFLGTFGFLGFLSGVFSRYGKGGVIAGGVVANAILVVYTNGALQAMLTVHEIIAASVLFAIIPAKAVATVKGIICLNEEDKENILKVREGIVSKLHMAARSFDEMSKTMGRLSEKDRESDMNDVAVLFDTTAERVCKNCKKAGECWGEGFKAVYRVMLGIFEVMEKRGVVTERDVEAHFRANCNNLSKLLREMSRQFEAYQMQKVWKSRLDESRELVEEQLAGVSQIINSIADEVNEDVKFDMVSAEEIRAGLEGKGMRIKSMNVLQDRRDRYRIELTLKRCYFDGKGERIIRNVLKNSLKREIVIRERKSEDIKIVNLEITEKERFFVETEWACADASEKSGDNHRFSRLKSGKYVIILSDGMGTGYRASKESRAIVELLDCFIEAGFDNSVAVKLINSIMIMKSGSETFATIDVCIIDLYTGEAQFIKTGAEPSFIMRKNDVTAVRAASLPAGIIAKARADIRNCSLREGDTVVMITDGLETRTGGADWIKDFAGKGGKDTSGLAERMLKRAVEENGGQVRDDMTVLCARLKGC